MTAPATLTDAQLDELEVLVGPDAWAYHSELSTGKVNLERAFRVRGDLRLVAVDILTAAVAQLQDDPAASPGPQVKRLKDGGEETEFFQVADSADRRAARWTARAAQLGVSSASALAFVPIIDGWGVA